MTTTEERSLWDRWMNGEWVATMAFVPLDCFTCGETVPPETEFETRLPPIMRDSGEYAPDRRCQKCAMQEGGAS